MPGVSFLSLSPHIWAEDSPPAACGDSESESHCMGSVRRCACASRGGSDPVRVPYNVNGANSA